MERRTPSAARRWALIALLVATAGVGAWALAPGTPDERGDAPAEPTRSQTTSGEDTLTDPVEPEPDTTTTSATPTTEAPLCSTAERSVEERASSLVFATLATPSAAEAEAAIAAGVGGLFVSSAAAPGVADSSLAGVVGAADPAPLVAIDEEGGRVQQLAGAIGPLPSAREMAQLATDQIRDIARTHGSAMAELGINMDFAPVVDVSDTPDRHVIGDRSFGSDPATVIAAGGAFAEGLAEAGLIPTFKHFPGHGRASGDSHNEMVTTPPLEEMEPDLAPYRELLAEMPDAAVMTGHLLVPGLTGEEPATTSPEAITGLLRGELGFDGLVVTDDLGGMRGVLDRHTTTGAATAAIIAGVDMVLVPAALAEETTAAIVTAVADGRLDEHQLTASADRVLAARTGNCA